ncbi:hypothetical protein N7457_000813 [Penicillium paradoxum]|uniref:uncharacterized protein n=1 Tax=Penicillium paradoxum TaxID=176176 RepID=UPI0025495DB0|nr:uncharacterized protein N7457_000813 [Penicillium paradoxum]KAJ5794214.1 hypothetical protein N7457_000813 [Penicillium paradoxum]
MVKAGLQDPTLGYNARSGWEIIRRRGAETGRGGVEWTDKQANNRCRTDERVEVSGTNGLAWEKENRGRCQLEDVIGERTMSGKPQVGRGI